MSFLELSLDDMRTMGIKMGPSKELLRLINDIKANLQVSFYFTYS